MLSEKQYKIEDITKTLESLYPETPIPLDHTNSFTLLIAVLLSAQCTDARVNTVTPKLFTLASTPYEMIKLSVDEIRAIIRPCGLSPRKSKAIHELSGILITKHKGEVPASFEFLEELPGVGHKNASVVMSQWYGVPAFPVDTHIHRLASRWGLSKAKNVEMTEKDLKILWAKETWNKRHLQIIFFGREYCPAQNHNLEGCLICSWSASKTRIIKERKDK